MRDRATRRTRAPTAGSSGSSNSIQAYWKECLRGGRRDLPAGPDVHLRRTASTPAAGRRRRRSGRSTARPTSRSTSTWASSTSSSRGSAPRAARSPRAYVVAHEYGHHIENLEGLLAGAAAAAPAPRAGASGRSSTADCFAGVWVNHAAATGFLEPPTQDQIDQALSAAAAVGDDRIQQKTQGQVDPEGWTHGSAEQRQHWFTVGRETGDPDRLRHVQRPDLSGRSGRRGRDDGTA